MRRAKLQNTNNMKNKLFGYSALSLLFAGLFTACNEDTKTSSQQDSAKMNIVCTSTMLGDLAKELGGDQLEVTTLCGPGVDPHTFVATPSDKKTLDEAKVIVSNGLHFESNLIRYLENRQKEGGKVFRASDALSANKIISVDGIADPHMWNDIDNWVTITDSLAKRLGEYDPTNKDIYLANAEAYKKELEELKAYGKTKLSLVPEQSRILITTHDAFAYFTQAYGFKTEALQGISTAAEAAQSDIDKIKQIIKDNKIKAIFSESTSNNAGISRVIQDLTNEGVDIKNAGELYADALGEADGEAGTYIKAYRFNIDLISNSLK